MFHVDKIPRIVAVLAVFLTPVLSEDSQATNWVKDHRLSIATITAKSTEFGPGYVFDDFDKLKIKEPGDDDSKPYWWVINNGDNMQFYDHHGDASSAEAEEEGGVTFARLQLVHDTTLQFGTIRVYSGRNFRVPDDVFVWNTRPMVSDPRSSYHSVCSNALFRKLLSRWQWRGSWNSRPLAMEFLSRSRKYKPS